MLLSVLAYPLEGYYQTLLLKLHFCIICICGFVHSKMLSECIVYSTTVFPGPTSCCLCTSDQPEQSVSAELSLGGCYST